MLARALLVALALLTAGAAEAQAQYRPYRSAAQRTGLQFLGSPAVAAVFTDSFNRADDNLEASANWTRVDGLAGSLAIRSNQVSAPTANVTGMYVSPDLGFADHYVEVTHTSNGSAGAGPFVCVRVTNGQNFIGVRQSTTNYNVFKVVGNAFTLLGNVAQTPAIGDKVRLQVVGNTLTVTINGAATFTSSTITDVPASTRTGLFARLQIRNPWLDDYTAGGL